jgi:hypothetical protein
VQDACYLLQALRDVGVGARQVATLRKAVVEALGAHVSLLARHLAELPLALFGAEDFLLDPLAALGDTQPVTSLPRRLEASAAQPWLLHVQSCTHMCTAVAKGMRIPIGTYTRLSSLPLWTRTGPVP